LGEGPTQKKVEKNCKNQNGELSHNGKRGEVEGRKSVILQTLGGSFEKKETDEGVNRARKFGAAQGLAVLEGGVADREWWAWQKGGGNMSRGVTTTRTGVEKKSGADLPKGDNKSRKGEGMGGSKGKRKAWGGRDWGNWLSREGNLKHLARKSGLLDLKCLKKKLR